MMNGRNMLSQFGDRMRPRYPDKKNSPKSWTMEIPTFIMIVIFGDLTSQIYLEYSERNRVFLRY